MRIFHDPGHAAHDSRSELHDGRLVRSFECPERMETILAALAAAGLPAPEAPAAPPRAVLERVHDPAYLSFLESAHARWVAEHGEGDAMAFAWPVPGMRRTAPPEDIDGALGHYNFSVDTCITAGTWAAALGAAGCAHSAARAVAERREPAFALARPPGHHAHADLFGGYCYLNNAAIAAETLRLAGAARVAVLDVDYHAANGTQAIFYERSDVLVLSLHADPAQEFPYFLGHAEETGHGPGLGRTINFPMRHGTDFAVWSAALDAACREVRAFGAEGLVVSLGADTYEGDPISRFRLGEEDFPAIGRRIAAIGLPTLFVMEGGYAVEALGRNVAGVLTGFLGA
jgi:acetoin utilization deacetylase AcuC-like enzyme